ncbi:MAG: molybdopterin synthase sulfur carrier subunit [Pseudomonadota bacterium]
MQTDGLIRLKFFASIREWTGVAEERLPISEQSTVAQVRAVLASRGEVWEKCLGPSAVVRAAVNQEVVQDDHVLAPGDEVAFFPPVTGG